MKSSQLNRFSSHSSQSVSSGHRVFYDIPDKPSSNIKGYDVSGLNANVINVKNSKYEPSADTYYTELFSYIEKNIIGRDKGFKGPFGDRLILYCDYTASGRSLKFIEEFIYNEVLPEYANTHTTNTVTSLQTTMFRHEARDIIRNSCQASDKDAILFVGNGCTGAIHKLIHNLNLIKPPIVIVGPFEHHSNLLPWRKLAHSIHRIKINKEGNLDTNHLESVLGIQSEIAIKDERPLIGAFAAVSNVTGIISNVNLISAMIHRHHGIVFWDYATGAPYLSIDMNPIVTGEDCDLVYKDAVYFSMHKFIGGVQSPGVLIAKKSLFSAGEVFPEGAGGGTVFFVRRENQIYLKDTEEREEGGTPDIVGCIRAGLAFQLKEAATTEAIIKRENYLINYAWSKLSNSSSNLIILGGSQIHRIPIFSFLIRHEIRKNEYLFLHHNFVCSLLNDLFGIQSRSGCACAGPYAMDLIGINEELAKKFENALVGNGLELSVIAKYFECPNREIVRPGFVRINFPYYMPDIEVKFVLDAIKFIAKNGYKFLTLYKFNPVTSDWRHREHEIFRDRKWLSHISYKRGYMTWRRPNSQMSVKYPSSFTDIMKEAKDKMEEIVKNPIDIQDESLGFDDSTKGLRWFLLPSEVATILWNAPSVVNQSKAPFVPGSITQVFVGSENSNKPIDYSNVEPLNNEVVEEFKEITERNLFGKNRNQNANKLLKENLVNEISLKDIYLTSGYESENDSDYDIDMKSYKNRKSFFNVESKEAAEVTKKLSITEDSDSLLCENDVCIGDHNNSHGQNNYFINKQQLSKILRKFSNLFKSTIEPLKMFSLNFPKNSVDIHEKIN